MLGGEVECTECSIWSVTGIGIQIKILRTRGEVRCSIWSVTSIGIQNKRLLNTWGLVLSIACTAICRNDVHVLFSHVPGLYRPSLHLYNYETVGIETQRCPHLYTPRASRQNRRRQTTESSIVKIIWVKMASSKVSNNFCMAKHLICR